MIMKTAGKLLEHAFAIDYQNDHFLLLDTNCRYAADALEF